MGARYAGMHPELGPCGETVSKPGLSALQLMELGAKSGWDFLYVAGSNPGVKYPAKAWAEFRSHLDFLVVQDLFLTQTALQADVVLPALSFVEKEGSFINIEGRVQKLKPGKDIPEKMYSDGEIFTKLAVHLHLSLSVDEEFKQKLSRSHVTNERPKHIEVQSSVSHQDGALKATFSQALFDHGVRMKHNPNVVKLAKEPYIRLNPTDLINRDLKDGDVVKINTIHGKVKFDPKVAVGTAVIPLGFTELQVHELGLNLLNGMNIEIQRGPLSPTAGM
jgi:NADH-quinone oxidoreductase subunit G